MGLKSKPSKNSVKKLVIPDGNAAKEVNSNEAVVDLQAPIFDFGKLFCAASQLLFCGKRCILKLCLLAQKRGLIDAVVHSRNRYRPGAGGVVYPRGHLDLQT